MSREDVYTIRCSLSVERQQVRPSESEAVEALIRELEARPPTRQNNRLGRFITQCLVDYFDKVVLPERRAAMEGRRGPSFTVESPAQVGTPVAEVQQSQGEINAPCGADVAPVERSQQVQGVEKMEPEPVDVVVEVPSVEQETTPVVAPPAAESELDRANRLIMENQPKRIVQSRGAPGRPNFSGFSV